MAPGKRKAPSSPGSASRFVPCPTCGKSFIARILQQHAWSCVEEQPPGPVNGTAGVVENYDQPLIEGAAAGVGTTDGNGDELVDCPVCLRSFPRQAIEAHAWGCAPPSTTKKQLEEELLPASSAAPTVGTPHKADMYETRPQKKQKSQRSGKTTGTGSPLVVLPGDRSGEAASVEPPPLTTVPSSSQGNAVQRLMEGGKRAARAARELKIVPSAWPVECIEDVLPSEKADRLLARLLLVSRDWTSTAWFNANGVEGKTHKRSHVYRIPTGWDNNNKNSNSNSNSNNNNNNNNNNINTPSATMPPGEAVRRHTVRPGMATVPGGATENTVSFNTGAMAAKGDGRTVPASSCKTTTNDALHASEHGGSGHHQDGFPEGAAEGSTAALVAPPGSFSPVKRSESMAQEGSVLVAEAEGFEKWSTDRDRRPSTCKEAVLAEEHDEVAPEELLEIVPMVVEIVRSRQQQRLAEGLDGREGLTWNPNYCLCHVYDDHKSHLGAHSDTLSRIGPRAVVVGLSLGAKRVFMVQETSPWGAKPAAGSGSDGAKKFLDMPHNSAIVMWGGCQERYKHGVPSMPKGVGIHPVAGTKRISITLRERKETLPLYLLPVPDCRCGVPATLKARLLASGKVNYVYVCDPEHGQCGFFLSKGPSK